MEAQSPFLRSFGLRRSGRFFMVRLAQSLASALMALRFRSLPFVLSFDGETVQQYRNAMGDTGPGGEIGRHATLRG